MKFSRSFSKYCLKCKSYHAGIYKVCSACNTPLVGSNLVFAVHLCKKIIKETVALSIVVVAVAVLAHNSRYIKTAIYEPIMAMIAKTTSLVKSLEMTPDRRKPVEQTAKQSETELAPTNGIADYECDKKPEPKQIKSTPKKKNFSPKRD